jgi:PhoPQ-activated pathogenicity-related protein
LSFIEEFGMRLSTFFLAGLAFASLTSWSVAEPPVGIKPTALDLYVNAPDENYEWKVESSSEENGMKTTVIRLRSQKWRTEKDVNRTIWEHWLIVTAPPKLKTNKGFMMIAGGGNDGAPPTKADAMTMEIAKATGSMVAELKMIPNQPLIFHNDGVPRKEDDLIGYCWAQFLETGDATWLPRLPMVKSAVRAMDCLQEFSASEAGGGMKVEKFVVAGGSKRGWTTWMTGAADARCAAIIPIVIDVANNEPSLRHHAEVYGFWSLAIGNYYQHNILQRYDHPRMKELYATVDPYYYRDRLTMPKYVVNASGDQFFVPTSSQFYYDSLKGDKIMRYVPNADHSLKGSDAIQSILAFYELILADKPRPELTWKFENDGSIVVKSPNPIKSAKLWQANNPEARDFRIDTIGKGFQSTELKPAADGTFTAKLTTPDKGWTASFVEVAFATGGTQDLKVSTGVRVLPDKLPFEGIDLKTVKYEGEIKGLIAK